MLLRLGITWFLLLAAWGMAEAAPETQQLLARIILAPQGPGGQIGCPAIYPADQVPPARFDVYLDPELNGGSMQDYLAQRRLLLSCRYAVWLYCFEGGDALGKQASAGPTLVIEPDSSGQFPLAGPVLQPGQLYAWQAVASLHVAERQVQLWSAPLYFRTSPAETYAPSILAEPVRNKLEQLARLATAQERASAALQATLRGMAPYSNYPSASDVYLCVPLTGPDTCPCPDAPPGWRLSFPQLAALGAVATRTGSLLDQYTAQRTDAAQLADLGAGCYSLLQGWADAGAAPRNHDYALAVDAANRLRSASPAPDQAQALQWLNELAVAQDALTGSGTVQLRPGYELGFTTYAQATRARLAELNKLDPVGAGLLSAAQWQVWQSQLNTAEIMLQQLEQDTTRGRLSKSQLAAKLAQAQSAMRLPAPPDSGYLEPGTCRVDEARVKRLTAADAPQVLKLTAELTECHLQRLALALWPVQ